MGTPSDNNLPDTRDLLERARGGDRDALNQIFARHRDRLRRMVEMRLDRLKQALADSPGGLGGL
jgi:hypothetical protein